MKKKFRIKKFYLDNSIPEGAELIKSDKEYNTVKGVLHSCDVFIYKVPVDPPEPKKITLTENDCKKK